MYRNQWRDSFDDGGTPGYRMIIEARNTSPIKAWYRRANPIQILIVSFLAFLLLGIAVFVGGLALLFVWTEF